MPANLVRTKTPGIYQRGSRFVVKQRDRRGRMHTRSVATITEAKTVQAQLRADAARGELRMVSREVFESYAREWIETYTGRTARGFRDSTRTAYRHALETHAIPYFGRMRLSDIEPRDIKAYAQACADKGLGRHGVKNAVGPVKALLATAFEDGDIRVNPAANVRALVQTDEDPNEVVARALTPAQLAALLNAIPERWRLFMSFLACTGLRIGEATELRWGDIDLGSGSLRVSRSVYHGVVGAPKSRFGVRTVPLTAELRTALVELRLRSRFSHDSDLVFASRVGTHIDVHNTRRRIVKPAAMAAGVPWAGFHTLRHTFASMCFRNGCNAKQVQLLLGHHAASFTIDTYIHAMPEDLPDLEFLRIPRLREI